VHSVPLDEEIQVSLKARSVDCGGGKPGQGRDCREQISEYVRSVAGGHRGKEYPGRRLLDQAFFAARAGAFSGFLPNRSKYFCWAI
jgi:hypothetical protein